MTDPRPAPLRPVAAAAAVAVPVAVVVAWS